MGKIMNFPKDDVYNYQKGLNDYNSGNYYDAYQSFLKTLSGKTLKEKSIKYIVECLIELREYEKVYKVIENEFVDRNVDENFLIQKYIFTMYLEGHYDQVLELISMYKASKQCSRELTIFFEELKQVIDLKKQHMNGNQDEHNFEGWLKSDDFLEQMKVITNIEEIDIKRYKTDIKNFLKKHNADSQIKYILLKFLIDHDDDFYYPYVNKQGKQFIINRHDFTDLYEDVRYIEPVKLVEGHIMNQYPQAERYLKNIWLTYCVDYYPNLIKNSNVGAALLQCMLLNSMNIEFNVNEICKIYGVPSESVNARLKL